MSSAALAGKKRPTGMQWRRGVNKALMDNIYANMDAAFLALEQAVNAGWAACAAAYATGENTDFAAGAPTPIDTTVDATVGMRILVTNQTLQKNNGIYVVETVGTGANGTWVRADDLDSLDQVQLGDEVWVTGGTAYANTAWRVTELPSVWATTGNLVFTRQLVTSVCGSEAAVDALITGAYIDGDRLKAGGLTAANFKAALASNAIDPADQIAKWVADGVTAAFLKKVLAVEALDFSDVDIAAAVKAGTLPASKLEAGSATAGINGGDVKFTAAQAAGALAVATVPVILELTYPDQASGNADWTGLVGKHEVIDFYVKHSAAGDADDTYQLQTVGGDAITNPVKPGAAIGAIGRAAGVDPTYSVFANAATIRIAGVKVGATSSLAKCYVVLLPRA